MEETPIEPVIDTTPTGPMPEPEVILEPYVPIDTYVPPPEPESPYITTLEELMSTQGAIVQKEANDKVALLKVFNPERSSLKLLLTNWASQGFPENWVVNNVQANPPLVCSDSQTRRFYEYVLYLLGSPIQPFLDVLNAQVPGVTFNFFLKDVNTIGLNVSKA
jgi:hypothetical protein